MRMPVIISLVAGLLFTGCGQKGTPATQNNSPTSPTPASAPADYLNGLAGAQAKAIKTVDLASLNEAIQMFQTDKGRFPKDLNELVKEGVIPKIPEAPYGMTLDYDPTTGKVSVVSKN